MRNVFRWFALVASWCMAANPVITTLYTADPAALVYHDSLFLFTGHDEQTTGSSFLMRDWHVFSTENMVDYTDHGALLSPATFSWASGNAFAGHAVEYDGKFYWFVAVSHRTIKVGEGFSIGVAVADHPTGPWRDAIGSALITDQTSNSIELNIDPAVYIEGDERWLYWGSWSAARRVRLDQTLLALSGAVETVTTTGFFEAPWVHQFNGNYYLSYASGYPSTTNYAMSADLGGPWKSKGVINSLLENSETNHQAILRYRGHWYFIYHRGNLTHGGTYKRSVNIDYLYYKTDGTIVPIKRTSTGVLKVNHSLLQEGVYRIQAHHSQLYLEDSAQVIQQNTQNDSDQQLWELKHGSQDHYYTLRNLGSKQYLSVQGDTLLAPYSSLAAPTEFVIENASVEEGYFIFMDYEKDWVADILNISTEKGANLIGWVRTGTDNQKFHFEYVRDIQTTHLQPSDLRNHLKQFQQQYDLQGRRIPQSFQTQ